MTLTIEHLLELFDQLPKNIKFEYVKPGKSKAQLINVDNAMRRVDMARVNDDGSTNSTSLTTDNLISLVNNIKENIPFRVDDIFRGGGNTRSTYEAVLAHTSEFYKCKVGNNKHLIWFPTYKHAVAEIVEYNSIPKKELFTFYVYKMNSSSTANHYLRDIEKDIVVEAVTKATKNVHNSIYDIDTIEIATKIREYVMADPRNNDRSVKNYGGYPGSACLQYINFLNELLNGVSTETSSSPNIQSDLTLQKIVYGAPGTGKSFGTDDKIKEIYPSKEEQKENVFRTTFHPDSDYSTFVGAYKPTKVKAKQSQVILDYDSLVDKYKEYIEVKKNMTIASTLMGYDYHDSIVKMQPQHTIGELVADAYKNNTTYDSVLRGGMAVYESNPSVKSDKITYSFVPQTFTKAYVQAWKNFIAGDKKPVFLVIEEINRGNCAQIFGDLFQLLDRDDETGMSCYPIKPDTDLGNFIADELSGLDGKAPEWQSIVEGEELLLPSNLHIWATMNTSDQSLFPIDSAFKRRWKWEYVKIKNGVDKKTQQPLDWTIKFEHENGECNHKWWDFIQQINKIIASMTSSADKQLGYFFCKPDKNEDDVEKNTIISEEAFVGKVVFYLWNDVFKNYAMDEGNLFKFKPKADAKDEDLTFPDFYDNEGKVNGYVAAQFIDHVMTWEKDKED